MTLNTETGLDGEYVPSPVARVRTQVEDYEASGGVDGATLEGRPVVILTSLREEEIDRERLQHAHAILSKDRASLESLDILLRGIVQQHWVTS